MPLQKHRSLTRHLPLIALALLLGAQCVIADLYSIADQGPGSEYLTQARRCVELNDCPSRGGRTGGLPLYHGASWIRLLSHSLRAGVDQTRVQSIVLALAILSIPVTFVFLTRYLGLRAATLALGLYFPVVLVTSDIRVLTYTNLLPLPLALYYTAVGLFVESRRALFAAAAAIAMAAAVSIELGCIVMVPCHLVLVTLLARRKAVALAAAALSFAIPLCWESTDTVRELVRQAPTVRFAVGLTICAVIFGIGAQMVRHGRVPALPLLRDQMRAVMLGVLIYLTTAIWLACLLLLRNSPEPRYLLPAIFPFLYLIAEPMRGFGVRAIIAVGALEALTMLLLPLAPDALWTLQFAVMLLVSLYGFGTSLRVLIRRESAVAPAQARFPAVAICLGAIALSAADMAMLSKRGPAQAFTLAEAEQLVRQMYSAGYTYAEMLGALQGPAADDLLPLLTERDPGVFSGSPQQLSRPDFSVLAVKVPSDAIAATHGVIATVPLDGSRSAILVRDTPTYLDWTRMRRCQWTSPEGQPPSYACVAPRTDKPLPHNWPFVELGDAQALQTDLPQRPSDRRIDFAVPVHTPGLGSTRILRTAEQWPFGWHIARVSGVEFEGSLPGKEIRLLDRREATGVVELELTPGEPPWVWLPRILEVSEANQHLLDSMRNTP